MVPGYVPFALLLAFEAAAVIISFLILRFEKGSDALVLCTRCARLHARTEPLARGADAIAVGALAFLVALPFVAAGYESGFTFGGIALAASVVVATSSAVAEAAFLARALAARIWPRFTWSAELPRIVGGGARWLGILLAMYIFKGSYTGGGASAPGVVTLFAGVGRRLAHDLVSTSSINVAATILVVAAITALVARWLVPLLCNSLPTALAVRHGAGRPSA